MLKCLIVRLNLSKYKWQDKGGQNTLLTPDPKARVGPKSHAHIPGPYLAWGGAAAAAALGVAGGLLVHSRLFLCSHQSHRPGGGSNFPILFFSSCNLPQDNVQHPCQEGLQWEGFFSAVCCGFKNMFNLVPAGFAICCPCCSRQAFFKGTRGAIQCSPENWPENCPQKYTQKTLQNVQRKIGV